ncbi:MAG: hypothetical protein A3H70_01690 [Candidatus Komeilibacteria bacterium RIFCSPLOWO2_02_FULL_48_11]|uniref:Metallophosphoesterase n=1 Tax=Candidatus Komeilibacteria bacterium RIFCSPLOWO2_02_FULL_48_11 TaxID=1798553 RepID=A0A1G2BP50_9BACT|nr:MAG: hypothetical protein A3H70_01690 [Candidatus Komeilibacteria bacterium RIFCSPLOWO2_02_FULL_48_11]
MRIIFIGDIVGKIGRRALAVVLPKWKAEHQPDLVVANVENIAHGVGLTRSTLEEVRSAGVDFFTTGNHWADKSEGLDLFSDKSWPLIRPANWPGNVPGSGWKVIEVGATQVAIINLLGQVFMHKTCSSPFQALDAILKELPNSVKVILVDVQTEATSENTALGFYAAGRVSAVLGTHTHVGTIDARILSNHTAYITDIGMTGAVDSVIGDEPEGIIATFLDQLPRQHEIPETGEAQVNAVMIEVENAAGRATAIQRLDAAVVI